jgi:hypothetical protein
LRKKRLERVPKCFSRISKARSVINDDFIPIVTPNIDLEQDVSQEHKSDKYTEENQFEDHEEEASNRKHYVQKKENDE